MDKFTVARKKLYSKNGITLYYGDCNFILPNIDANKIELLLTDPPYGINLRRSYKKNKRTALAKCNDFQPIHGDNRPFDPQPLLKFSRCVIFGANNFAGQLPSSQSWLVWDKLNGLTSKRKFGFNDSADAELAWTNLGGPIRLIPHRWMGMLKESERREKRVHPTQKPVALMEWIIEHFTKEGDLILDPYAGSGSTLIAARNTGRKCIGIECSRQYCQAILSRLNMPSSNSVKPKRFVKFIKIKEKDGK